MSGKVNRFEDLDVWKVSRELANKVYNLTKSDSLKRDYGFVDQMRRASVSVMNNVAEGYERGSNKDFAKYLFISKGSAGEVRSMLYIARDQGYINDEIFAECYELAVRCNQLCWGLIKHLQKNSNWKVGAAITLMILASTLVRL